MSQNRVDEMKSRGVTPLVPYPGANTKWECECQRCESIVYPRYSTVVSAGKGGCNICAKKDAAALRQKATEKLALQQADRLGLKPLIKYPGAHKLWRLECKKCGEITEKMAHGVTQGKGCRFCQAGAGGRAKRESNSEGAIKTLIEAGLTPIAQYPGTHKPWLSICQSCGQIASPRLSGIKAGQGGCRNCGNAKKGQSRRIPDTVALELFYSAGAKPLAPYMNANTPVECICLKCGSVIHPRIAFIKKGHSACRRCALVSADSAFDYFGPATFYLIRNKSLGALKVGIAGAETKRLSAHVQKGWEVLETLNTE